MLILFSIWNVEFQKSLWYEEFIQEHEKKSVMWIPLKNVLLKCTIPLNRFRTWNHIIFLRKIVELLRNLLFIVMVNDFVQSCI